MLMKYFRKSTSKNSISLSRFVSTHIALPRPLLERSLSLMPTGSCEHYVELQFGELPMDAPRHLEASYKSMEFCTRLRLRTMRRATAQNIRQALLVETRLT